MVRKTRVLGSLPEACSEFSYSRKSYRCFPAAPRPEELSYGRGIEPAGDAVASDGVCQLVPGVPCMALDVGERDPTLAAMGFNEGR
eukprot:6558019-Alexandrium_andersonii.AAC.1